MFKRILFIPVLCLFVSSPAYAQFQGGGGHGGRGGHSQGKTAPTRTADPAAPADTPLNAIEIVGVVQAVDPATSRLTIAYEPVDALDWPKGVMPFEVAKPALMQGVTVGEKVRFKLSSQQIAELKPY